MQAFQALFQQLDQVTGTRAKVGLLVEHFRSVPAADAALGSCSSVRGNEDAGSSLAEGFARSLSNGVAFQSG
jgi:hypothetical protein